ncbi:MAG TPA: hypothetical protein VKV74_03750 [Bryobacteraceae bacterium]|nr:hypothetical protein [Bryobacteraceae bacterium]
MAKLQRLAASLLYWRRLRRIFDREFYLRKYPDVADAGVDPFRHYLEYGASEGRKPHPLFDHDYYLLCCREGRQPSEPSILHFLKCPVPAGNPHPLFDCESYLLAHPDVAKRKVNPLLHYLSGAGQLRSRQAAALPANHPAAQLEIRDVSVTIVFGEGVGAPKEEVVRVWEDASGRMRFTAPPEQRPFFAAVKYDQLRAQMLESGPK